MGQPNHVWPACIYGQMIKTGGKNGAVATYHKLLIGSLERLEDALVNSGDSDTLNTPFIEKYNLTIRQGSSSFHRRTATHTL
jgi:hypothetical protein